MIYADPTGKAFWAVLGAIGKVIGQILTLPAINGLVQGIDNLYQGNDFWDGFWRGFFNSDFKVQVNFGNGQPPTWGPRQEPEYGLDLSNPYENVDNLNFTYDQNPEEILQADDGLADIRRAYSYIYGEIIPASYDQDQETIIRSPELLRMIVPGQISWDNARTAWANGRYGESVLWTGMMLGEDIVYALSFGQSMAATQGVSVTANLGNKALNYGRLSYLSNGAWRSSQGLIYEQGSVHGNRVLHVLDHCYPNLSKPLHTVFNVGKDKVLGLIDEAWSLRGSAHTIIQGNRQVYTIPMRRIVGTNGEDAIKIIVEAGSSRIVTAYPVLLP